jgi:hypothetical protein
MVPCVMVLKSRGEAIIAAGGRDFFLSDGSLVDDLGRLYTLISGTHPDNRQRPDEEFR